VRLALTATGEMASKVQRPARERRRRRKKEKVKIKILKYY